MSLRLRPKMDQVFTQITKYVSQNPQKISFQHVAEIKEGMRLCMNWWKPETAKIKLWMRWSDIWKSWREERDWRGESDKRQATSNKWQDARSKTRRRGKRQEARSKIKRNSCGFAPDPKSQHRLHPSQRSSLGLQANEFIKNLNFPPIGSNIRPLPL